MLSDAEKYAVLKNMDDQAHDAWVDLHKRHTDFLLKLDRTQDDYAKQWANADQQLEEDKARFLGDLAVGQRDAAETSREQEPVDAISRSQEDIARSQFAAQFAAEQERAKSQTARDEQEQNKSRFLSEDRQRQEGAAEVDRAAESETKSRFLSEEAQRQLDDAQAAQQQQEQARQQELTDVARANQERGKSLGDEAPTEPDYSRPPTEEQVVKAEAERHQRDMLELREQTDAELRSRRQVLEERLGDGDPDRAQALEALWAKEKAEIEAAHKEAVRRMEEEARQRLERMLAPYELEKDR